MSELKFSEYQTNIFDFIQHQNGNLVIEASAGCGKTTTMVQAIRFINPSKKILFCSFNTEISKEIENKVKGLKNVKVSTIHSLGKSILSNSFREETLVVNEMKYKNELCENLKNYTSFNTFILSKKKYNQYIQNILNLVNLMRFNLLQTAKDSKEIIDRYDIQIINDEVEIALKLMEWGKNNLSVIDYTDMVWLPLVKHVTPKRHKYDFIFVDECQDLSTMQRELVLICRKINTRFIFCGDSNQSIYGFCSADINSFNKIKEIPNTTSLQLPISYRCADKIVDYAKAIVPSIKKNLDGRSGEIKFNCKIENIDDGDLVLCRNNAPLMKLYDDFLKIGKKCHIKGREIGTNLKALVETTEQEELNNDLTSDGVFVRLYNSLFELRDKIMEQDGISEEDATNTNSFSYRLDSIKALEVLSKGLKTATELNNKIDEIFSDHNKDGIILSTIHKAKGLESENVFILCPSLMPSKSAKQVWEIQQEINLKYVAFTRAKNFLGFIDENDFKSFITDNSDIYKELGSVEYQVNKILNKTKKILTLNEAREVVKDILSSNTKDKKFSFSNVVQGFKSTNTTKPLCGSLKMFNKKLKNTKL